MKNIFAISLLLMVFNIKAQLHRCYDAPSVDFGGVPIAWSYQVEDPLVDTTDCLATLYEYQRSELWIKPIEYKDKIIGIFGNQRNATIINAFDKETGDITWQKLFHPYNTEFGRGFSCPNVHRLGKDSLELLGYRDWVNVVQEPYRGSWRYVGYPARRIISLEDGEELFLYKVPIENVNTPYPKWLYWIGVGEAYPHTIGDSLYHDYQCGGRSGDTMSLGCQNYYVNKNTLLRYYSHSKYPNLSNDFPNEDNLVEDAGGTVFQITDPLGGTVRHISTYISKVIDDTYMVVIQQYFTYSNRSYHSFIYKIDPWGHQLNQPVDMTYELNGDDGTYAWNSSWIDQYEDKLRIKVNNLANYPHQGYVDIDFDGNLIKDRKLLNIDGMTPRFHRTIDIKGRYGEVLHVFRPLENNNLYIYREDRIGNFVKLGELINPNDSFYVFIPKYLWQSSEGDLIIGLKALINPNLTDVPLGGWGAILKINAEELGLSTGTEDNVAERYDIRIYPNPTTGTINISTSVDSYPIHTELYDVSGRQLMSYDIKDINVTLDISRYSQGIYYLTFFDSKQHRMTTKKIVKIK